MLTSVRYRKTVRDQMATARDLIVLLDRLENGPGGTGPFIGRRVSAAVRSAKYPAAWCPLVERYTELVRRDRSSATLNLYCDLACTVITKKIRMVDMFYLHEPKHEEFVEEERFREAHMAVATQYLAKMLTCVEECAHGRLSGELNAGNAATLLYAELYAEAFDVTRVSELDVFRIVEKWLRSHVFRSKKNDFSFRNVAPGVPFFSCSHAYWLWLHLSAAKIKDSATDLLTMVYALDTIVYCDECKRHFLRHRSRFFHRYTVNNMVNTFSTLPGPELLFRLHNRINEQTGSPEVDRVVLSEYVSFWEEGKEGK